MPDDNSLQSDLLNGALPVKMPAGLALDDPRGFDIVDAIAKGHYARAAVLAQQLWKSDLYDVRFVGHYLHGVFLQDGIPALPGMFESVSRMLTDNWDAFGPAEKKLDHADRALRWLFRALIKHLDFHYSRRDEQWKKWSDPQNLGPVGRALEEASKPLHKAITSRFEKPLCLDWLVSLESWLREYEKYIVADHDDPLRDDPHDEGEQLPVLEEPAPLVRVATTGDVQVNQDDSPALAQLKRKLDAFKNLVDRGEFPKAAVAASDIQAIVDRFDPREYLPKLFSPFYLQLSRHVDQLEATFADQESIRFKTLAQLYQVDLDAFLQADGDAPRK